MSRTPLPVELAAGWVVVGGGLHLWRLRAGTRRPGTLMVVTGLAWIAGGAIHWGPLGHLLLAWPSARTSRPMQAVIALAYAAAVIATATPSPALALAYGLLLLAGAGARIWQSSGLVRRGRMPACAAALLIGGLLAADGIAGLAGARPGQLAATGYALLVAGSVLGLVADARWGAKAGAAATGLVIEVGRGGGRSFRDRLAEVLGDPTLLVGFATAAGDFRDERGRVVELPTADGGRSATVVEDAGQTIALIVHDATVLADAGLVAAAEAATRITIANARLRVEIDRRTLDLEASQRRILTAADDQRREVERRLDAGALRRLGLVCALVADPEVTAATANAPIDLTQAVDAAERELRAFARGVYPHELVTGGLAAAIDALATAGGPPTTVSVDAADLPADVETSAYLVCAEALANATKHAAATAIHITVRRTGEILEVEVADDGVGGTDPAGAGIQGLRDRVGVLGGVLDLESPDGGGTTIRARIPIVTRGEHGQLATL